MEKRRDDKVNRRKCDNDDDDDDDGEFAGCSMGWGESIEWCK